MAKKTSPRDTGKPDIELGVKIRALRQAQKVSQDVLGKKLGVSFQQIQKYEKGINRVSSARLQQIALIFKVPLADFYAANGHDAGVESMLLHTDPVTVELLRAYSRIKNSKTQHSMVVLVEVLADRYG